MRLILLMFCLIVCSSCCASRSATLDPIKSEPSVEVLLIGDKFQNTRGGDRAYLYDATIYIVVREGDRDYVESQIEGRMGRISQSVTEIFSKASPETLHDPGRIRLKQAILKICPQHFGTRSDGSSYVQSIIISNWKRFSTDL